MTTNWFLVAEDLELHGVVVRVGEVPLAHSDAELGRAEAERDKEIYTNRKIGRSKIGRSIDRN